MPTIPYTHSLWPYVGTHPGISSDTRLQILSDVRYADTSPKSYWLTYDTTVSTNTISTTDELLDGTYSMQVYSWFAYNSTVLFVMQPFKVILKDRCRKAIITPTPFSPATIYYQINSPAIIVPIPDWTYDTQP
jgi:hypothetical protein